MEHVNQVPSPVDPQPASGLRRQIVRCFALLILLVIAIDTSPDVHAWLRQAKVKMAPVVRRPGLWQGQWPLFAPNPVLNNAWISAEITSPDGELTFWNSPYWGDTGSWEKFYRFRYLNYYNRLPSQNPLAIEEFADFLARTLISPTAHPVDFALDADATTAPSAPTWKMSLFRSKLNFTLPEDGSLPSRDEILWIASSKNLTVRAYRP
ncbi:MAG: hypothetical protein KDA45_11700 [Planctomycetales bacterium]|nr:hypothetical protein [Planctomycetales bacterium]